MVLPNGADHISLHNLHVVDVVKQFEALGPDLFAELHAPRGAIAKVVVVIHFAVEQLHTERDAVFLRDGSDPGEALSAGFEAFVFGLTVLVARENDHVGLAGCGDEGKFLLHERGDLVVISGVVEALGDAARDAPNHGAFEAVFEQNREFLDVDELHGVEAGGFSFYRELFERVALVAPFAGGVFVLTSEHFGFRGGGGGGGGGRRQGSSGDSQGGHRRNIF